MQHNGVSTKTLSALSRWCLLQNCLFFFALLWSTVQISSPALKTMFCHAWQMQHGASRYMSCQAYRADPSRPPWLCWPPCPPPSPQTPSTPAAAAGMRGTRVRSCWGMKFHRWSFRKKQHNHVHKGVDKHSAPALNVLMTWLAACVLYEPEHWLAYNSGKLVNSWLKIAVSIATHFNNLSGLNDNRRDNNHTTQSD